MVGDVMDRVEFTRGDAIGKLLNLSGLTQKQLAIDTGLRPNTITDLVNSNVESEPDTIKKVCDRLDISEEYLNDLVAQMNGRRPERPRHPDDWERDYDKNPIKREAAMNAQRIAALPLAARLAIYNVLAALEEAYLKKT
jgi:transcriptional regulator with XRE-family HTH domain